MPKTNEIVVYNHSRASTGTGEIEEWDTLIFQNVIRKKLISLIREELSEANPGLILDYGCGGGWLSVVLSDFGFNVVGVDISANLLKNAKSACPMGDFVVCDAEKLPFNDGVFDHIVGISILHHLDISRSCSELKRISANGAEFLFEEPNLLNPFSALGRKFFPMETHTEGEKPFLLVHLKKTLSKFGLSSKTTSLFFLAFPFSRLFKVIGTKPQLWVVELFSLFEEVATKIPLIRQLNASLILSGVICK